MTNIISPENQKKHFLTPQRAVILIPVIVSILLTTLMGFFAINPLIKYKNQNHQLLKLNRLKKSRINKLEKDLITVKQNLEIIENQKNNITNIIASDNKIQTIIAKLSWLSNYNSLRIIEIKTNPIQKNIPISKNSKIAPGKYKKISDIILAP